MAMKSSPDSAGVVPKAVCILNGVKPVRAKYDGEKTGDNYQPSVGEMIVRMSPPQPLQTCDKDDTPVPAGDASVAVGMIASLNASRLTLERRPASLWSPARRSTKFRAPRSPTSNAA